jgi:flagellar export protein FliJ
MRINKSRMHTIIKVKTHLEKKAQQELKSIRDSKAKEQQELNRLQDTHTSAAREAGRVSKARADELASNRAFLHTLSSQIRKQETKVDEITVQEDHKREELVARSQSKQMVEKLDAKRREEAEKEIERKEQNVIDSHALRNRQGLGK